MRKQKGGKKNIESSLSDHLTLLNAFRFVENLKPHECPSYLNLRAIKTAHEIYKQILGYCADITATYGLQTDLPTTPATPGVVDISQSSVRAGVGAGVGVGAPLERPQLVLKCLCRGLPLNVAQRVVEQDTSGSSQPKGVYYKVKVTTDHWN
jgi:hypothetical protein